jgi:UDP-2,3-diacylglucosamine hydrolase
MLQAAGFQDPMSDRETKTVCVFSDLHVFCRRSEAAERMGAVHEAMEGADLCVLNGDIFDFRWTVFEGVEETVPHAIAWLEEFMARYSGRRFHYILGNHDAVGPFIDRIETLAHQTPELTCHPLGVKLDQSVFLHGDVAHYAMSKDHFEGDFRAKWRGDRKKGRAQNWLYDRGFDYGVHRWVHRTAFPPRVVAKRVANYLREKGLGPDTGTTDVYLGHTHIALSDYEYEGLRFHNTGAPMPGLEFRPMTITLTEERQTEL